ncbi:MAG: hypothetical protein QOK32_714, partial [Gaiellaceae bacterium]|nr:hypothetical protein [Gaiellaceae bacterium]
VAAVEVMVMNTRIADLIRDNQAESIPEAIEDGAFFDMQSFTKALIDHVLVGNVDREVAANAATNRHDFLVSLDQAVKQQDADIAKAVQQAQEAAKAEVVPGLRIAGS